MARSLKTTGLVELGKFRKRVRRQLAYGRISTPDAEYLCDRLDQIEARVVSMTERNEQGEEE